jgi:hypothetical protein
MVFSAGTLQQVTAEQDETIVWGVASKLHIKANSCTLPQTAREQETKNLAY